MTYVNTHLRTLSNLVAITFLSIVVVTSFPSGALATPKENRIWSFQYKPAANAPSNCPTEEYLRTSLAANLDGRDPFENDAPRSISVTIERLSNEVEARITIHDDNGTVSANALHAPSWRCDQLAERIVFALQNIVDPLALPTATATNASQTPSNDPPKHGPTLPSASQTPTTIPSNIEIKPNSAKKAPIVPQSSSLIPKFGLSFGVGPAWWNAPKTALSAAVGIEALWKRAAVSIEGHYEYAWAVPDLHDSRAERTTVMLIACGLHRWSTRFMVRGCGFGDLGKVSIEIQKDDFINQYSPVADIGARVGVAVWPVPSFSVELRADAAYAITRPQVHILDDRTWRAAPFAGALRLAFLGVFEIFDGGRSIFLSSPLRSRRKEVMGDFFQGPPPSRSRRSFAAFYKANISTVVRILGRTGVHPADIPDIAQQVFEKIYKKWDELGSDGPEVSLDTICRQQAANHYRLYRHRFEQPEPNVGEDMPAEDEDAQAQLERHELDQIVQRILGDMTPECRDLLIRREFQKESLESIAEAHNIARNTATAPIAEAKKVFRLRAERMLGDKRSWLLFVPWMIRAHDFNAEYSEECLADVQDRVWRTLAREVAITDEDSSEGVAREADHEPPPSKSRTRTIAAVLPWSKPLLGALTKPVYLLGAGVLGGIAVASLWPHASPAVARRMPSLPVVVLEHETTNDTAGVSLPSIPSAVVQAVPAKASPAPLVDRDLRIPQRARTLIAQGSYAEALAALRQHEKDFPQSEHRAIRGQYIALAEEGLRRVRASTSAPQHF